MRTITIRISHTTRDEATVKKSSFAAIPLLLIALGAGLPFHEAAAAGDTFTIAIKDHRFDPSELEVPAGKKLKLVIKNLDATPEEFESHELKREKIIAAKGQATINIGPLKPGTYKFVGEFHESTAQGRIVAK
ncbi:MAG: cupredoxin domain-containing protein [Burkholderiales bacterium]|nr:cupredoxin domain-containing protein [Burkholderiales bacterium]